MRRLICFDMDSTLIETEVIDELAIRAGVGDEVKALSLIHIFLYSNVWEMIYISMLRLASTPPYWVVKKPWTH